MSDPLHLDYVRYVAAALFSLAAVVLVWSLRKRAVNHQILAVMIPSSSGFILLHDIRVGLHPVLFLVNCGYLFLLILVPGLVAAKINRMKAASTPTAGKSTTAENAGL